MAALTLLIVGCSKADIKQGNSKEMQFAPQMSNSTKATDTAFENGDEIGIFVVKYENSKPSPLQLSGNWANNAKVSFNGSSWTVSPTIWWSDENIQYDIFSYYPFESQLNSVDNFKFNIETNQQADGYTRSDFMWAKTSGVKHGENAIPLNFKHKLSRIDINLLKGEDFEGEIPTDAEVRILNTVTSAQISLETGDIEKEPYSTEHTVYARKTSTGKYSAIIVPQKLLNQVPLVEIIANNISYLVSSRFIFESGMRHTMNVTLSSDPNKVIINIGGKIDDWN